MNSRLLTAIKYMQDAFLISFVLLFFESETVVPLVILWLGLNALLAAVLFFVFRGKKYQLNLALFIAVAVMAVSLAAGASLFLFIVFAMLSVYRMHARFSAAEDEVSTDGLFMIIFILLFSAALFFSLVNPGADEHRLLFPLAVAGVIFYVFFRMMFSYLSAKKEGARLSQFLLTCSAIFGSAAVGGLIVYSLAESVRQLAGNLFGGVLGIALKPLGALLTAAVNFLSGLSTEEEMQENLAKMNENEEITEEANEVMQLEAVDYSFTIVATIAVIVFAVLLLLWLRKVKTEEEDKKEKTPVQIDRYSAPVSLPAEKQSQYKSTYSAVDMNIIRQAFRDFEILAAEKEQGREPYETVREWMARKNWSVSDAFFKLYDLVRYGEGYVSQEEARPFLEELEKLNKKILKENV